MLIEGDPQSGKSWVAGLVCEQMILQGYSVCVIDPEGDYRTLEPLPGVVIMGGTDSNRRNCRNWPGGSASGHERGD